MASGDTLIIFGAQNFQQPASAFAYLGMRNAHPVVLFTPTGDKACQFSGLFPRHYTNSGVTVTLIWAASSSIVPAENCRWGVAFERMAENDIDIDADSFATEKTVDAHPLVTSGALIYTTLVFTNGEIDGIIAGEAFRLQVRRITTSVTSNMSGNAQLAFVELRET